MNTISVNYRLKWELKSNTKYKWSVCGKMFNTQTGRIKKKQLMVVALVIGQAEIS